MPDELVACPVRAFFAPVDRVTGAIAVFNPATLAAFDPAQPPAPWLDLGECRSFIRSSATVTEPLNTGAPASTATQVRTQAGATLTLQFSAWDKLHLALTAGVQQTNVLDPALPAQSLLPGASATTLLLTDTSGLHAGDLLVVDTDYTGATGFIGSGASGGYIRSAVPVLQNTTDLVRRVSYNVARVVAVASGSVTLASPLLAGIPATGMKVQRVTAFCDREGGSFFQEWSALFLLEGEQGDRLLFHYPRLQSMAGPAETAQTLAGQLAQHTLPGHFRALPIRDPADGETVLCFRIYLPQPKG